ncbi:MAG: hypothetical protein L6262_09110 [Weeksellaceae bacterium]|nr:hypothetical protein [Weeksellaceae bacterium]
MKKTLHLLVAFLFPLLLSAQKANLDSQIEQAVKKNNIEQLNKTFDPLFSASIDSLAIYSEKVIALGEQYKSPQIITYGYIAKSFFFYRKSDLVNMQDYLLKANHLLDKKPNHFLQGVYYQSMSYLQPTEDLQLYYCKKAVEEFQKVDKNSMLSGEEYVVYANMAQFFTNIKQTDSALSYVQKAENIIISKHKPQEYLVMVNRRYCAIYLKQGQLELAKNYAFRTLKMAEKIKTVQNYEFAWGALAQYYDKAGLQDSAFVYNKKLYESVGEGWYRSKVKATGWLYHYYLEKKDNGNTLKYGEEYIAGIEKMQKLEASSQIIKINLLEKQRQDEKERKLLKEKEEKANTLQLILIAIGILSCFILYLILSRSFIVSPKTIEILGMVVMLIVFEFINLLLHGFIAEITHHSPVLMLLALVIIALIIVPLHHRLEKWTTQKLLEKNKKIRLSKEQEKQ